MKNQQVIRNILREVWPDELKMISPAVVDEIIAGQTKYEQVEIGSSLDISAIVSVIADAVALIVGMIELRLIFISKENRTPSTLELRREASKVGIEFKGMNAQEAEQLLKVLVVELDRADESA